jgi:hypothetical protein
MAAGRQAGFWSATQTRERKGPEMEEFRQDGWMPSPQGKVKNPARFGAQQGCSKVKRDSLPRGNGLASIERCLETGMNASATIFEI